MRVGTIKQIWRYPFKSMLGELLEHAEVNPQGVLGDRGWAVRDEVRGGIGSAKKIPALMHCQARYPDSPTKEQIGPAEITVPDGTTFLSNDPEAAARLSQALSSSGFHLADSARRKSRSLSTRQSRRIAIRPKS